MWLSSTAQQAIHAVLCIADCGDEGPVRVDEIAAVIGVPRNYLSKTLYALTRAGVLRSERGPRGGFRLATPPDRITLASVVAPFEPMTDRRCLVVHIPGIRRPCNDLVENRACFEFEFKRRMNPKFSSHRLHGSSIREILFVINGIHWFILLLARIIARR